MTANWTLQEGIYETLSADAAIVSLLGGPKIFDHVPRKTSFPYVTLGQTIVRDWSTGTEDGREHILTFHVWSRASGKKETEQIISAVNEALAAAAIPVPGHHLVNFRFEFADTRRDPDGETMHGILRYRAVTEPVN